MSQSGRTLGGSVIVKNAQLGDPKVPVKLVFTYANQPASMPWSPEFDLVLQIFFFAFFKNVIAVLAAEHVAEKTYSTFFKRHKDKGAAQSLPKMNVGPRLPGMVK